MFEFVISPFNFTHCIHCMNEIPVGRVKTISRAILSKGGLIRIAAELQIADNVTDYRLIILTLISLGRQ